MDYSWFWDERFWFPSNRSWGWKDIELKEGSDVYLPQINDLYAAISFGVALVLVRFMFERWLVVPIALQLGVSNRQRTVPKPNPVLETAFKQHKSHCPDHKTILALSKQTDLPERAVQIWFRRRQLKDAPTPLQKFRESSWQLVFYSVFFIYGMMVVWNKPYMWKTSLCWIGWPFQHVSNDLYWYYITELAFYWSQIFTLFYDHRRKDFIELMIHHVATIGLLSFSWVVNFVRIGSLVLVVHDAADSWLSLSKLSNYLENEPATTTFFGIFIVVWILSRLILYPYVVLYSTTVEAYSIIYDEVCGSHFMFNVLLYTLQVLHILWSYMIFHIIVVKFTQGHTRDIRSDDEDSEDVSDNNVGQNRSVSHGDKTKGLNPATFNHKSTN